MMNDLFKMEKALEKSGYEEGDGFTISVSNTGFLLTIYKTIFVDCNATEDIEFHFEYDKFGNLIEVW